MVVLPTFLATRARRNRWHCDWRNPWPGGQLCMRAESSEMDGAIDFHHPQCSHDKGHDDHPCPESGLSIP